MQLIASYPVQPDVCRSYIGKPVMAVTVHGDTITGVLHEVNNGYAYFRPLDAAPNVYTQNAKKKMNKPNDKKKGKKINSKAQALKTRAVASPYPYAGAGAVGRGPVGRGFGFGVGAGLGFAVPLLLLSSLFLFPFFI